MRRRKDRRRLERAKVDATLDIGTKVFTHSVQSAAVAQRKTNRAGGGESPTQ